MWQVLILFYFVFGATTYLLRRVLAKQLSEYNLVINSIFFVFFLLPVALVLSFFFPHNLNVGFVNLVFLFGGSIIWPLLNIVSFKANKDVDVGIFTIINNLSPFFTVLVALPFLHESLGGLQVIGVMLLIASGIIAASSQLKNHSHASKRGILFSFLAAAILGVAIVFERFMLGRIDFGAYLIYGWGAQVLWMVLLTGKELKKLPALFHKSKKTTQTLLVWGAANVLKSVAFILALKISGSASIISAATDFLSVVVVLAAYLFLNERQHMLHKWLGAGIGITGLLLIAR